MKVEWWWDTAAFYPEEEQVVLARLTVRDDGTAQVLLPGPEIVEFENEDEAENWLSEDEYSVLETLIEVLEEEGKPVDPRIKPPTATSGDELLRQMVIDLKTPATTLPSGPVNATTPASDRHPAPHR